MFLVFNTNNDKLKIYNSNNFIVFDDVCSVKYLKDDEYILIIIDKDIEENGIMRDYNFLFEEILISINVKMIITNVKSEKLQEITDFYKIPLIVIN